VKHLFPTITLLALTPALFAQSPEPPSLTANVNRQVAKVHATNKSSHSPYYQPTWTSLARYQAPDWFRDAKFGIFIHWGVYSVPAFANEWYSRNMYVPGDPAFEHHVATYGPQSQFGYKDFIPMFHAEHFNPSGWVSLFARAGAKYIVPVAEHSDGFPMYDSDMTTWDAARLGPHRDIVGELEEATRARGLHFGVSSHRAEHWWWYGLGRTYPSDVQDAANAGLYGPAEPMSLPNPDGTTDTTYPDPEHLERWLPPNQAYIDDWLARSTELVDKYHPDFFYFDWWIGQPTFQPALQQFAAYYYNTYARRNGNHRDSRNLNPVLTYKEEDMPANVATLDIERGKLDTVRLLPWQTDTSISIHSWGYVEHDEYRTAKSLIHQLIDTVSKNGNLLLNIGPKADGTIPDQARTVLLQIGDWMRVNGESIYNTRPFSVFGEGPTKASSNSTEKDHDIQTYTADDIRYTIATPIAGQPTTLYATALGWPTDGKLILKTLYTANPYLTAPICSVDLLGSPQPLPYQQHPYGLAITLPANAPNDIAYAFRIRTCSPPAASTSSTPPKPHHKKKKRVHHHDEDDDVDCCTHIG
jgi:alpha-L-fucosidase